ncbi:MAG: UDP-glucose 4-epimerase GalE [Ekhidna sp.]|uniref:UDP-glucose 4-epimerase GalE n=1 Tax=Ekhidna sp. TaxID=2608089 RepID=UPI0032EDFDA6
MKNVLVTGGLGFIGSHTCVELLERGYNVFVVDNLSNSQAEIKDRIEEISGAQITFVQLDLVNSSLVKDFFEKNRIDSIIHFAAYKAVGESVERPLSYYENNLLSLINLLKMCELHRISHFVFSSSCTVYGQPDKLPVTEDSPKQPAESPYGNTKQICEEMIEDFCKSRSNFKAISLRYFNPIGAHKSGLIGELPLGIPNNLVPFITQTAAGIREKMRVFGGDYNTPDGTCIRDYIHVVDLAKAHISALEYSERMEANYDFFNVGTGKGYSVLDVIKSFEKVSGTKLNYEIVDRRPGDVEQIFADTKKVTNVLGWRAELDLDTMVKSAWEWQKTLPLG